MLEFLEWAFFGEVWFWLAGAAVLLFGGMILASKSGRFDDSEEVKHLVEEERRQQN